jgi:hypothetical protein
MSRVGQLHSRTIPSSVGRSSDHKQPPYIKGPMARLVCEVNDSLGWKGVFALCG